MKEYSAFPRALPSDGLVSYTMLVGSLTHCKRCSRCILQPQATGLLFWGLLSSKAVFLEDIDFCYRYFCFVFFANWFHSKS